MQIIVEIISVGVTVEKEKREEDEATSSLLTLEPPRLLFILNDISVAVFLLISMRDFGHSVQLLLFGDTGRSLSFNKERERFTEMNFSRSSRVKHVL